MREDIEEQEKELDKRNLRENSKEQYEGMGQKYIYRLAVLLLILTGFFEDFPVVLVTFYTAVAVSCGTPARQEVRSVITMVTIISPMMNSLWTMIILFCELCGGQKFYTNISYSCLKALCQKRSTKCRLSNHCCKEYLIIIGRTLLLGFIFLLFSGNFFMGVLTIGHIHGSVSLRPLRGSFPPRYLTHSVPAGPVGPGLDGTRDEAMFIYIVMDMQFPRQVVLYDNEGNIKAKSMWTNQILNRIYIGQFEELSHLKERNLTKAIPCSKVFPFVDKIEESFLVQTVSMEPLKINISDCKLILNIRYYPTNNDWNPFKEISHKFYSNITIEWGFYVSNESSCDSVVKALRVNDIDILTSDIKDDLIKYTCSSACGDDANICDNTHPVSFQSSRHRINSHWASHLFLAINDLKVSNSCFFNTSFEYSQKFCGESWSGVQTVDVPQEIQDVYPQFITITELYTFDETVVPRYYCNEMWNNSISCCGYPEGFPYYSYKP